MSQVKFDPLVTTEFTEEEKRIARANLGALSTSTESTDAEKYQIQYNLGLISQYATELAQGYSTSYTGLSLTPFRLGTFYFGSSTKLTYFKLNGYTTSGNYIVHDSAGIYTRSDSTFTKLVSFNDFVEEMNTSIITHTCDSSYYIASNGTFTTYYLGINSNVYYNNNRDSQAYKSILSNYRNYSVDGLSTISVSSVTDLPDTIDISEYTYSILYCNIFFNIYRG